MAGSHGFDIWSPDGGIGRNEAARFADLLQAVRRELQTAASEPRRYRSRCTTGWCGPRTGPGSQVLQQVLAAHPGELKLTPGKMV